MMSQNLKKCCAGDCNATSETHRLFNIPKDDKLRDLWLSFLIPTNIELSGLSKNQLVNKRVCQKHFDRHQFDSKGNRLQHGYPCLFTDNEILHGIPFALSDHDHLSDHNYALQIITNDSIETADNIVIEEDHSYASSSLSVGEPMEIDPYKIIPPVKENPTEDHSYASSSLPVGDPMEIDPYQIIPPIKENPTDVSKTIQKNVAFRVTKKPFVKNIVTTLPLKKDTNCTDFVRRVKKMTFIENKTYKPFEERLSNAENLSQDFCFINNFNKMTKHAQNFLMMQLKLVNRKKKAMRFTTDEKLLSLALMKESPKGYRLLSKIFKLPSKRTLNRLSEKITVC